MRWLEKQPLFAAFVIWPRNQRCTQVEFEHAISVSRRNRKPCEALAVEKLRGASNPQLCRTVGNSCSTRPELPIATINPKVPLAVHTDGSARQMLSNRRRRALPGNDWLTNFEMRSAKI